MTMIAQYGVAAGSALTTVVHAEDAQPNEMIQGQKRKRALPPKIMVSTPQPRYTNVPSGRQAMKSGLQYAIRSRPWRGGRGGYANQGGRRDQDTTRDRTNDRYGGGRYTQSDDAVDRRIKIVSVSEGTTRSTNSHKRPKPDSESSGSTSAGTTTLSAQASTTHVQPASVSAGSTSTNVRLPKRRKVNRPGIHDVAEEIIIGPRSPEASTAPSARRVIDAQPPPAPALIDLTFLDGPGLYVMPKSPQSPHHDDGLTSPLYVPFIPATVDLRLSPLMPSLSTLPAREAGHSQLSKETRPEVAHEHQTQKGRDRGQNSNKEARPRSPSPFLLPSLRRKTSQELYTDNSHSLSSSLKPALPTRRNVTRRTGTITPPSPSPKIATPFLPPLNLPASLPLRSTTIMGDGAAVAISTPMKRIASGIVKEETLISPSVTTPSAGPSRRLITSGCEFYPMPESCSKTHPDFKENRKTFAKEKWRHLQSFGFVRKKCTVREDGLAIEWESPVPVWSDTYLKEAPSAPSIADAIQSSLSQNYRSTESISTNVSLRRKKGTAPPRSPLLATADTDKGKSHADIVLEELSRNDAEPVLAPVAAPAPAPVSPPPPPRTLPSVKKPIHLTLAHNAKNGSTPAPNDDLDDNTGDKQYAYLKAAPKKADTKGRKPRVIMSLEEALKASLSHNARHIKRIKKSKAMKGHFEEEEEEGEESDSDEDEDDSDSDDDESEEEEDGEEGASPVSKSKRKRSRSVSASVKRARLSGFRKDRYATTKKPQVVEVIDLTLDDSSDEKGSSGSTAGGQAPTAKGASVPAPAPDATSGDGDGVPETHAVVDTGADGDMGRGEQRDQAEPEVKKMVFKPNHVQRRRARSPPVFTNPWKSMLVSLEEVERGSREKYRGVDPCVVLGDRNEVVSSGGVDRDRDVQQRCGEEEQAEQHEGVIGACEVEDEDELMYPPTPELPIPIPKDAIPTFGVEMDLTPTHVGVDALPRSATAITTYQEGDDFPLSSMHDFAPTMSENATITTAQEVDDSLPAALGPLSVPVLAQSEAMALELPENNAGGVVDGGRYLGNGSDNTKEAVVSVSASSTIHMKIDEDEAVGANVMGLAVGGHSDEIEEVTQRFLERYISFFDSDREMLKEAYTDSTLFSCSAVGCQPSAGSLVSNSSSEPSPAISAVSRALAGNPKISQGSSATIDVLKQLGPFQFYRHEDFSVYYDLAPLPRLNGANDAHRRNGDRKNPNLEAGVSTQAAERYLLSVHAQLYNATNPMDVADRLAVDQSFLLCRGSGALGSSEGYAEGGMADTSHRVDGGLAAWPLTILSHQMTLRRTPLLSEEKLVELLPWAQEILR